MTDKYNGWTNYETWAWKLWIDNDQGWQEYWLDRADWLILNTEAEFDFESPRDTATRLLANELQTEAEDMQEQTVTFTGPLSDLLGSAIGRVEWREIAESLIDSAEEVAA